ncbi:hypothetical protein D3C73_1216340 [compost metagenome]
MQAVTLSDNFATRGNHTAAVIDRLASLTTAQIGVHIGCTKGARPLFHKLLAHLMFADSEMGGAWIDNDINPSFKQLAAWTGGYPGIFADFKANADTFEIEYHITK